MRTPVSMGPAARGQCGYCGRSFANTHGSILNAATWQHVLPKRRGGTDEEENLRACCRDCNDWLNMADDCPGALACARAILGPALTRKKLVKALTGALPDGLVPPPKGQGVRGLWSRPFADSR